MQTQKDRVDAYNFMMGRMTSALVLADPSSGEVPARRARLGLVIGLAPALLIVIGFCLYGLIVPGGSTAWKQRGAILVEKETGTRFVYHDGALRPTLNQASALLVQGREAKVRLISRRSLAGLPRGGPIGLPGAPDTVPTAKALVSGPWLVCLPHADAAGRPTPPMTVLLDPATPARPVGPGEYVVAASPAGDQYLLLGGRKHRLAAPSVPVALGADAIRPVAASPLWLRLVPDGPVLGAAHIARAGAPGPAVAGRRHPVGQLFRQRAGNGAQQLYVLRADGLSPLTGTEFALLAARPGAPAPIDTTAQAVAGAPRSADTSLLRRLPDVAHATAARAGSSAVCLAQRPAGATVATSIALVDVAVPAPDSALDLQAAPGSGMLAAAAPARHDARAVAAPGSGMLAAAVPARPGARIPDRYLITDQGIRYLLADDDTIEALGFSGVPPVPMARELLSALPAGPVLSRSAAAGDGEDDS